MDEQLRGRVLRESRKALELMQKSELSTDEQDAVIADCVENFSRYVNPGILDYRKSVSTDYTAVEWSDGGATFKDIRGREFIDCLGGFGIYMLGHRHPTVMRAVQGQLQHQALHSQELLDPMRGYLCELVAMVTPGDLQYSFLVNSGTEATEGALKFAKVYAYEKKPDHMLGVISTTRAFHGKSMGSLSVSGKREFRVPFQPLVPGSRFVPYGDADALERELEICDMIGYDIAAFIVEPVQGEAGAIVPPDDYLPRVREICDGVGRRDDRRRGTDRHGPHRQALGRRQLGRRARHHDHGEGLRRRRDPLRQHRRQGTHLPRHVRQPLPAHDHLRRQPAGNGRGDRRPARDDRRGHPAPGRREGRRS